MLVALGFGLRTGVMIVLIGGGPLQVMPARAKIAASNRESSEL